MSGLQKRESGPFFAVAIRLRKAIGNEWLLVGTGVVSIIFGILVFLFPTAGALALIWLISVHAIVTGTLLLMLAYRMQMRGRTEEGHGRFSVGHS